MKSEVVSKGLLQAVEDTKLAIRPMELGGIRHLPSDEAGVGEIRSLPKNELAIVGVGRVGE